MVFQATPVPATGRIPMIPSTTMTFDFATSITASSATSFLENLSFCPLHPRSSSLQRRIDQLFQHLRRIEVFFCKRAGSFRMSCIVRFNLVDRRDCLPHRREGEEPFAHWQHGAEAGVLDRN